LETLHSDIEASEEFASRLGPTAIEKLTDNFELRKLVVAEAPHPRETEFPFDGALETLRSLSARYKIGVIANQTMGSEERLTRWGLMPFVSVCIASAEIGIEKPDPAIFDLALRVARCFASEAAIIGDRLDNDIRQARNRS
jgi:putative hydrolase of the HAD superfamily